MKKRLIILVFLAISSTASGENALTVPYGEFKQLYADRIRQDILKDIKKDPFVYAISRAGYEMGISAKGAVCRAVLSGNLISGPPGAFKLFSSNIIIRKIHGVTGGALVSGQGEGISFFPSGAPDFSLDLTFFIPSGEDNTSSYIALEIPPSLENKLSPSATGKTSFLDLPGVKSQDGIYHFSTRSSLKIRFAHGAAARSAAEKPRENLAEKYRDVHIPPVVLDTVHCYTSFEESGNILSVIRTKLPPEAGENFTIRAVPGAEIWQCRINNKKVKVYQSSEGNWILPLPRKKTARIELALLSKGEKMGLQGRLEMTLPALELPARQARITLGLPKRVEMVSFQGPAAPAAPFSTPLPGDFSGVPYCFSRSFHKGEAITMAISYKEPVNRGK